MNIEEIAGKDGQTRCSVCGAITRRPLDMPLMDGTGRTQRIMVRIMCRCEEKAAAEKEARRRYTEDMVTIRELKQMSLMNEKLRGVTFSTFSVTPENQKVFTAARRYVERFNDMYAAGQGLLLHGPVGTGKSYTAAVIANELMNRKHSAIMTSFVKLLQNMSGLSEDGEYIDKINRAKLLIIDDLGTERETDTALEKVYNVIDSRYRSHKPIILTTNLSMKEIKEETDIRYVRIYDRIVEMCYPMKLDGLSWRKQEAAARFQTMKNLLEG